MPEYRDDIGHNSQKIIFEGYIILPKMGCEYYLHFQTEFAHLTSKVALTKDLYKKGDSFSYRINLAKMHIFDSISTESLF